MSTIKQANMKSIRYSKTLNYFFFEHLITLQQLVLEYLLQKDYFSSYLPFPRFLVFFYLNHFVIAPRILNQAFVSLVQNSINMIRTDSIMLKNAYNQRNRMLQTFLINPLMISTQRTFIILMIIKHKITHASTKISNLPPLLLQQHLFPIFLDCTHSTQTIIISSSAFKPMTSCFRFELLLNLRYLEVINLKQSTFFQIRASVYQQGPKEQNHFAVPFLILKSEAETPKGPRSNNDPSNAPEIDNSNNTFLTRRMLARNLDDRVQMNQMCVFKGSLLGERSEGNKQIRIYCELLCFQQNEVEVVAEWEGYTRSSNGHSYLPIYFNSYKFTGNLHATIHSVLTAVSIDGLLQNQQAFYSELKSYGNVQMYRKNTEHLEIPIQLLKNEIKLFTAHKVPQNLIEEPFNFSTLTYRYAVFLKESPSKNINEKQQADVEKEMAQLNRNDFVSKFKEGLHLLNQGVYQLWKKLQILLMTEYSQPYEKAVRTRYQQQISQHHRINSFIIEQTPTPTGEDPLFIYPFQKHDTMIKMSKVSYERAISEDKNPKKQLIVFVHGYQASSFDMEPLSNYLKFRQPNVICLLSSVNEGRTEQPIEQSAHRLAIQIKNFINSLELKQFEISFVCHSLGGLIARACMKYLQLHKEKFKQFISLCSPHLGYLYHSSALISTSLWILNKVKKDPSVIELTLSDAPELQKTYLYALSSSPELSWFSKIWLFGSREDEYAPFWSTILEQKSFIFETQAAKIYKKLLQNLTAGIQNKIVRCQIVFNQKSKDLSTFIGRTAHIKILNFIPAIELLFALYTP